MTEAVGLATSLSTFLPNFKSREFPNARFLETKKNAAVRTAAFSFHRSESNYFDTDFLNTRSIFSLVASQQAWLA
jgi:hypothetical protein